MQNPGATRRPNRGAGVDIHGRAERPIADDVNDETDEEEGRERLGFDRLRSVSFGFARAHAKKCVGLFFRHLLLTQTLALLLIQ